MEAILVMFKADGSRKDFPLSKPKTILGRKHTCDLRIPVPSVSREHCRLEIKGNGLRIVDLQSSNGTIVNDKKVDRKTLKAGDVLTVGPCHFVLMVDGKPAEIKPVKTILPQHSGEVDAKEVLDAEMDGNFALSMADSNADGDAPDFDLDESADSGDLDIAALTGGEDDSGIELDLGDEGDEDEAEVSGIGLADSQSAGITLDDATADEDAAIKIDESGGDIKFDDADATGSSIIAIALEDTGEAEPIADAEKPKKLEDDVFDEIDLDDLDGDDVFEELAAFEDEEENP